MSGGDPSTVGLTNKRKVDASGLRSAADKDVLFKIH